MLHMNIILTTLVLIVIHKIIIVRLKIYFLIHIIVLILNNARSGQISLVELWVTQTCTESPQHSGGCSSAGRAAHLLIRTLVV